MKKLLLFLLSLTLTVGTFSACNLFESESSSGAPSSETTSETTSEPTTPAEKTYTVTFVQEGKDDIVKTVKEGASLTDIPDLEQKTGYTTVWSITEFPSVTENLTVTAITTIPICTATTRTQAQDTVNPAKNRTAVIHKATAKPTDRAITVILNRRVRRGRAQKPTARRLQARRERCKTAVVLRTAVRRA